MSNKRLVRSNDKMVAGVAAGIAEYIGIDVTIVRLLFVLLGLFGGNGLLIYFIMWIVMPEQDLIGSVETDAVEDIIIEKGG